MKRLFLLLAMLVGISAGAVTNTVSQLPNTNVLADTNLFMVVVGSGAGKTNMNISFQQLSNVFWGRGFTLLSVVNASSNSLYTINSNITVALVAASTNALANTNANVAFAGDVGVDGTLTVNTLTGTLLATNQESVITAHLANPEGTNITLQAWEQEAFIGTSNVNVVAIMQGNTNAHYVTITITNGTGVTWGLSFSPVTNRWTWLYAKAAPTVMTNATQLLISTRVIGTNVLAAYDYAPWP